MHEIEVTNQIRIAIETALTILNIRNPRLHSQTIVNESELPIRNACIESGFDVKGD
jgi:hypothetical protein